MKQFIVRKLESEQAPDFYALCMRAFLIARLKIHYDFTHLYLITLHTPSNRRKNMLQLKLMTQEDYDKLLAIEYLLEQLYS